MGRAHRARHALHGVGDPDRWTVPRSAETAPATTHICLVLQTFDWWPPMSQDRRCGFHSDASKWENAISIGRAQLTQVPQTTRARAAEGGSPARPNVVIRPSVWSPST